MTVLLTGTAGFTGSHIALKLIEPGDEISGFYNPSLIFQGELFF